MRPVAIVLLLAACASPAARRAPGPEAAAAPESVRADPVAASAQEPAAGPVRDDVHRTLPVELLLDEALAGDPDCVAHVGACFDAARAFYRETFGIDLAPAGPRAAWTRPAAPKFTALIDLWDDLRDRTAASPDLVIGVSGGRYGRGGPLTGMADSFGRHVLVFCPPEDRRPACLAETLVHEIAHTFGAWHSLDPASSMRAYSREPAVLALDDDAADAVRWTRDRDLAAGVAGIAPEVAARIGARFAARHIGVRDHPVLTAWEEARRRAVRSGDAVAANACIDRALETARRDFPRDAGLVQIWESLRGARR